MKKTIRFGFTALVAVMVLAIGFSGCGGDGDSPGPIGGGDGGGDGGGNYLITGKFESQTGSGDAVFYADYVSNGRSAGINSVSRAVGGMGAAEKELSGKIEDGDIIFNLKGVYNTETEKFLLSAGSSLFIYQLAGTLSESGVMSDTTATVKIKTDDDWVVHEVEVTATEEAAISGDADTSQQEGLPSAWFGLWEPDGHMAAVIVTAFQLIDPVYPDSPTGIMDMKTIIPGEKYETVWVRYRMEEEVQVADYSKVVMEIAGANLKCTVYYETEGKPFAEVTDYPTNGAPSIPMNYKRP